MYFWKKKVFGVLKQIYNKKRELVGVIFYC